MKKTALVALILFITQSFYSTALFAQAGKDGAETISTSGVVFNRYDVLATSISAGATTFSVTNVANLAGGAAGVNNPYATSALAYGDLIMIIKMQGATIDVTNTTTYGNVTAANGVGTYELAVVRGVTGNVITVCTGLSNAFAVSSTQRVQVVRAPRLSSLTINSGSSLTTTAWGGTTGGIVAVEVNGNAVVNGTITTSGLGFRGGALENNTIGVPSTMTDYVNSNSTNGAEKGESIAGTQADYDALGGRYNRGAAANGGGGGNGHNAGGGGGANAGAIASWNGNGNPDNSVANWTTAWNLESAGFATNTSTGGGRGGYTYASTDQNALTTGPGNSLWGGDYRRNVGGIGGRPLTYTTSTLFLGGGGGAGDANNNSGGAGGNGGGIIYLLATGTLSGTGSITANGANGTSSNNTHNDAPGGAGGGGAIRLNIQGAISSLSITANGGIGGSQFITSAENEGPGGGGGYVSVPGTPAITVSIAGGNNGTTSSSAVTEFIPNGATRGGAGSSLTNQAFVAAPALSCSALPLNFLSFTATLQPNNQVLVNWSTASEVNVRHFEIQVSTNQLEWTTIAQKQAVTGQSQVNLYNALIDALQKTFSIRIKSVDLDGSALYSLVRSIKISETAVTQVYAYGNKLYINRLPETTKEVRIFSAGGQLFLKKQVQQLTSFELDIDTYPSGIYYLQVNSINESKKFNFIKR